MSEADTKSKYAHGEAFALMWYECECGHRERIWNSRDGVTPFCIGCPSCGGLTLQHGHWNEDEKAPQHVPYKGQMIFRDGTPQEAVEIMERRFKQAESTQWRADRHTRERLLKDARETTGEWQKGWPTTDRTLTGPPFKHRSLMGFAGPRRG